MSEVKFPQAGDIFYPKPESKLDSATLDQENFLAVTNVGGKLRNKEDVVVGRTVIANDDEQYDCVWSDKLGAFVLWKE